MSRRDHEAREYRNALPAAHDRLRTDRKLARCYHVGVGRPPRTARLHHRQGTALYGNENLVPGKALPSTEMKISSLMDGTTLPLGEQGEVCTRGYMVMKGYDDEPEATVRAIDSEGWLHTGDVGLMRPDGYIHLTGRAKDMIIRGGENIYPREIEEFLYTHPKV